MRFLRQLALFGLLISLWWMLALQRTIASTDPARGIVTVSLTPVGLTMAFPAGLAGMDVARSGDMGALGLNRFNADRGESESVAVLVDLRRGTLRWVHRYANSNCCGDPLVHISPDGSRLLAAGSEVVLWERSGKVLLRIPLPEGAIGTSAVISADGRWGLILASDGTLTALDMRTVSRAWSRERFKSSTSLAANASGGVIAVGSLRGIFLLRNRDGGESQVFFWPGLWRWASVALNDDGDRLAAVWKLPDGTVVAGAFLTSGGGKGPLWTRSLWRGTVPLVKVDAQGQTIAVGDLLGQGATLLSWEGRVLWRSPPQGAGVHIDLSPDGKHLVVAFGRVVEVRRLPDTTVQWQSVLPGVALKVRISWPWVIGIGTLEQDSMVPNRIWLLRPGSSHHERGGS